MKNLQLISTILLIFTLSIAQNVFSQESDPEEDIFIRQLNENQFGGIQRGVLFTNQAILTQVGSFNSGNINQQHTGNFQQDNLGVIIQVGNFNESDLTQIGSGNRSLSTQIGSHNTGELNIEGNFNTSATLQLGNNNNFNKTIAGDNQSFNLLQLGNSNTLSLGAGALPGMKVTQQGNGMSVVIR